MRRKWYFIAPLAILAMALFAFIGGEVVMLLWNWLVPQLIGWRQITFWQAFGILVLCRILFGGWGSHGRKEHGGFRMRERMAERMGERMRERWERMSPEERERFRQGLGGCWGPGPMPSQDTKPAP